MRSVRVTSASVSGSSAGERRCGCRGVSAERWTTGGPLEERNDEDEGVLEEVQELGVLRM